MAKGIKSEENPKETKKSLSPEVLSNIEDLISNKSQVILSTDDTQYSFLTHIKSIQGSKLVLHNSIPPEIIKSALGANSTYLTCPQKTFKGGKIDGDGKYLYFNISEITDHSDTREEERLSFDKNEHVYLQFRNPYDNETINSKRIFDLSSSGLSFETFFDSKLYSPGQKLINLKVLSGVKTIKECSATIIYKKKLFDSDFRQRYQIGLKLEDVRDLIDE